LTSLEKKNKKGFEFCVASGGLQKKGTTIDNGSEEGTWSFTLNKEVRLEGIAALSLYRCKKKRMGRTTVTGGRARYLEKQTGGKEIIDSQVN